MQLVICFLATYQLLVDAKNQHLLSVNKIKSIINAISLIIINFPQTRKHLVINKAWHNLVSNIWKRNTHEREISRDLYLIHFQLLDYHLQKICERNLRTLLGRAYARNHTYL